MSNMPLISLIIPVYKVEKYLDKCVESVVNQTYKNLEIILVDDGSPDNCPAICDKWGEKDSRIKVIHKVNGGVSTARNIGIEASKGKYISFVDSDDYISYDFIEKLHCAIEQNECEVAMCNYMSIDMNYNEIAEDDINKLPDAVMSGKDILNNYYKYNSFSTTLMIPCAKLFEKSIFENLRFKAGVNFEDDFMFFPLFLKVRKAVTLKDKLYFYLQREDSVMHSKIDFKKITSADMFFRERLELTANDNSLYKKTAISYCVWIYLTALVNLDKKSELSKKLTKVYRKYILKYVFDKEIDLPIMHRVVYFISTINPEFFAQLKETLTN